MTRKRVPMCGSAKEKRERTGPSARAPGGRAHRRAARPSMERRFIDVVLGRFRFLQAVVELITDASVDTAFRVGVGALVGPGPVLVGRGPRGGPGPGGGVQGGRRAGAQEVRG